jgi:hypothetical protein
MLFFVCRRGTGKTGKAQGNFLICNAIHECQISRKLSLQNLLYCTPKSMLRGGGGYVKNSFN